MQHNDSYLESIRPQLQERALRLNRATSWAKRRLQNEGISLFAHVSYLDRAGKRAGTMPTNITTVSAQQQVAKSEWLQRLSTGSSSAKSSAADETASSRLDTDSGVSSAMCPRVLSQEFLQHIRAVAADCRVVLYTAVFGEYDQFSEFASNQARDPERENQGRVCRFAFMDQQTLLASSGQRDQWTRIRVAPVPFPDSLPRSAHSFKAIPWTLFPKASWVFYLDGKVSLSTPPLQIAASLSAAQVSKDPALFVLQHPIMTNRMVITCEQNPEKCYQPAPLLRECGDERKSLLKRARPGYEKDLKDVDLLRRLYCSRYGPPDKRFASGPNYDVCSTSDVIESSFLAWHHPRAVPQSQSSRASEL